jgi:hypothetical protein
MERLYSASAASCVSQKRTRPFAAGPKFREEPPTGRLAHALYAAIHTRGIRANTGPRGKTRRIGRRLKIARMVFAMAAAVFLPCWFYTAALINSYVYQ